jgi:EAL domain-containing protein (putative c-di-GMP-specific phosphodiesterase class I)/GGDEF domain-containing protein
MTKLSQPVDFIPQFLYSDHTTTPQHSATPMPNPPAPISFLEAQISALGATQRIDRLMASQSIVIAFQPLIDVMSQEVYGYEALARPPKSAGFAHIGELLIIATAANRRLQLEFHLAIQAMIQFTALKLSGRLFVNLSPEALGHPECQVVALLDALRSHALPYQRVVIELTEQHTTEHPQILQRNLDQLRLRGVTLALDDFAAGYNGLLHWLDRQPDIVKIDRAMLSGIDQHPKKYRFVRSVVQLAKESGARVVAEGVEHAAEARVLVELGVDFLQGYLFGQPSTDPIRAVPDATLSELGFNARGTRTQQGLIQTLIQPAPCVQMTERLDAVMALFLADPQLRALPVLDGSLPVGIAWRHDLMNLYASPYGRPLNERRSISRLMDRHPVIVDESESLTLLSRRISERDHRNFHDVFIITRQRAYAGVGQLIDLLRLYTTEQVRQAQHLNPLSGLPGNVPINEALESWLQAGTAFTLVYADLDYFKAINDYYGYQRGDRVLLLLAQILNDHIHPAHDFLGHVGGDDFVILFQSPDWRGQCAQIIQAFDQQIPNLYDEADRARGFIETTDREGQPKKFPFCSLTLAALTRPAHHAIHSQTLTEQISVIKSQAKKQPGNVLKAHTL